MDEDLKGLIFDIQGFSVHDGPGCRTLIFMKGCPLQCKWCDNPEGRVSRPQLMYSVRKCRGETYTCIEACPEGAISVRKRGDPIVIDRSKCEKCTHFSCIKGCYNDALRVVGRYITVKEMMRIIHRDRAYWGYGGGVTFGGGEPLAQPEFVIKVLKECYKSYIHTAMETCAHVPWEHLKEALRYLDWIFVDIKHMDPKRHEEGTGVTNELILKNIERMATLERAPRMMVRMPVVPGFNDSDENVTATAEFMKRLGKDEINVLPFHRLGASKYEQLGWDYPYKNVEPPTNEKMLHIKRVFERYGIRCYIGSNTPF